MTTPNDPVLAAVQRDAHPLSGAADEYDRLLALVGDARFVLIGEASHGTHEFYRTRAEITQRLIQEKGFTAVAVEADWPDAYRVNRYVRGVGDDPTANESLADFRRFPTWMWRNADVLDFVGWLRDHNDLQRAEAEKAGFYGLGLYRLDRSIEVVLASLDKVDPKQPGGRGTATRASRISTRTPSNMGMRPALDCRSRANAKRSNSWSSCSAQS